MKNICIFYGLYDVSFVMDFMSSHFQEHKEYALGQIVLLQKKIDLLCWLDMDVCDHYADYLSAVYGVEESVLEELAERQEDQDLPSKEKIDELVVEMMLGVFVDCEDMSLYDVLHKSRPIYN